MIKILLSCIIIFFTRSCIDSAEDEFLAIGPNNTPVTHVSQEKADYCTEANIVMKLMYHGIFPIPSQSDIHSSADFDLDQRITLNEAKDYLEYYHGIVLNRYYYNPSDSASQDAVADTLA